MAIRQIVTCDFCQAEYEREENVPIPQKKYFVLQPEAKVHRHMCRLCADKITIYQWMERESLAKAVIKGIGSGGSAEY